MFVQDESGYNRLGQDRSIRAGYILRIFNLGYFMLKLVRTVY
jgi:hypothetical protein